MTDILNPILLSPPRSTSSDVSTVLQSIIDASPFAVDASSRTELIKCLLRDVKAASSNSGTKTLSFKETAQALLAVKTLGKNPAGSEYLASPTNLSALLTLSSSFKDDPEASGEALRCIANALLLIEKARSTFLEKEVDGGTIAISMLEKSSLPDHIFILSRILFLSTASGPSFIQTMVESKYHGRTMVEIIGAKLDTLTVGILAGTKMAREAMSDLLKLTFNLLLHYPKMVEAEPQTTEATNPNEHKVLGDFWSSKLDGLLPPLLRTFTSLPPTFPGPVSAPLTHVIHSLITVPINRELRPVWFGTNNTTSPRHSASNSPKHNSRSQTPAASSSSSRSDSPTRSSQSRTSSPIAPKPSTLDRAISVLAAGRRSLSRSPSSNNATPTNVLQRACDLMDVAFSHYFPGAVDVDDAEVRARCKAESPDNTIEDMLAPLVVLISRLCIADEASRVRVRQWIVPDDLNRSSPLEGREDILGRCLRLMASVYHPRLKDAVGELLYAMCDSDAANLSALVGYGNVAGFLFHKGILSAPSTSKSTFNPSTSDAAINPITGTTVEPMPKIEMTDEEKEQEMEKLFVLFDRLEKTGAIPSSQNPMRKAIQQATFGS
ncbi:putative guanine nucleotide exchange factor synembryn [Lyophyllum shimeji]|uniref:Guanine nucleotide exchange factor synembryn n=1 Tax=Lyophyllum shimeji TaxID=47721 RepID=A0A9P3PC98_LYOSH|nr:putative guanine nucleotide exchange factor synembryn [Lyophyllum shimeji]